MATLVPFISKQIVQILNRRLILKFIPKQVTRSINSMRRFFQQIRSVESINLASSSMNVSIYNLKACPVNAYMKFMAGLMYQRFGFDFYPRWQKKLTFSMPAS